MCKLNSGIESPYEIFRYGLTTGSVKPITTILIKLVAINGPSNTQELEMWNDDKMNIEETDSFINEINVQTDIFLKTIKYLDPICPGPIYGNIIDKDSPNMEIIKKLVSISSKRKNTAKHLNLIIDNIEADLIPRLGLFCMEMADDGYATLGNVIEDVDIDEIDGKKYEMMTRFQYVRLAMETGYSQNDFHHGNILVKKNDTNSFIPGSVILIDFGWVSKISLDKLTRMKDLFKDKNYYELMQIFYTLLRPDDLELGDPKYKELFKWITGDFDNITGKDVVVDVNEFNTMFENIRISYEQSITDRIQEFNDNSHANDRENYPLLPLSNAIKNKLFGGITIDSYGNASMMGGKKSKTRKSKTIKSKARKSKTRKSKTRKSKTKKSKNKKSK